MNRNAEIENAVLSTTDLLSPDRPVSGWKMLARRGARRTRIAILKAKLGKRFRCGDDFAFGKNCHFFAPEFVHIGNGVRIGYNFLLETNLTIGDEVLISSNVSFVGNDHRFDLPEVSIFNQGRLPPSHVKVEGDNLIGNGVIIIGNVRIGRGVVVGAGSVVTRDLSDNGIYVGVPARRLRDRC